MSSPARFRPGMPARAQVEQRGLVELADRPAVRRTSRRPRRSRAAASCRRSRPRRGAGSSSSAARRSSARRAARGCGPEKTPRARPSRTPLYVSVVVQRGTACSTQEKLSTSRSPSAMYRPFAATLACSPTSRVRISLRESAAAERERVRDEARLRPLLRVRRRPRGRRGRDSSCSRTCSTLGALAEDELGHRVREVGRPRRRGTPPAIVARAPSPATTSVRGLASAGPPVRGDEDEHDGRVASAAPAGRWTKPPSAMQRGVGRDERVRVGQREPAEVRLRRARGLAERVRRGDETIAPAGSAPEVESSGRSRPSTKTRRGPSPPGARASSAAARGARCLVRARPLEHERRERREAREPPVLVARGGQAARAEARERRRAQRRRATPARAGPS